LARNSNPGPESGKQPQAGGTDEEEPRASKHSQFIVEVDVARRAPDQENADTPGEGLETFLLGAGLITLLYTFDSSWAHEGQAASFRSKVLAGAALFLWVGVMFWGSMLPFIGNAF